MPTAHVNGIDIWYRFDDGTGPTLIMTHGYAGPTAGWPPIVDELRERYRLLQYDVRGHGKTTVPDASTFSFPQFAADLAGLMDALAIDRAHILGVSMGGMVSAQFACDFPERVRSLLLCDTTAGNGGDPATAQIERDVFQVFEKQEHIVTKYGLAELVRRENAYRHDGDPYASRSSFSLEEQDERNNAKLTNMTPEGYLATSVAFRSRPDLTSRTPRITAPVLVSCGEWDMFYPLAQRDHRLIAHSRMATVRFSAHDTLNYRPQSWKRAVTEFLDAVESGDDTGGRFEYSE